MVSVCKLRNKITLSQCCCPLQNFCKLIILWCVRRLLIWKEAMEKKGLRVNAGRTKVMTCGTGLDLLQSSGDYPCTVCRTGVGNNNIYWMAENSGCIRNAVGYNDWHQILIIGEQGACIYGRPQTEVQVWPDKLEVVASFYKKFDHYYTSKHPDF